ncbi:MAG TPA: carboxynorspermidine decarboxylase [Bacteroidales bacterium]|nr:carboxynorspermidine decarboxylase [Bacteroidales bacterium]
MAIDFNKVPSPCYVLDEALLRRNLQIISNVRDKAGVEIIVALKGFAMWSAFPILREYGFKHATASSLNEATLANEIMGTPAHTYCPAYSPDEFDEIVGLSSHITFNSLSQFEFFKNKIKSANENVSVGLRINPGYSEVKTMLYNPCAPGARLGIPAQTIGNSLPKGIDGLHFHTLCESSSYDLEKTLTVVEERFGHLFGQIKWINMGGGHLMTRKDYDTEHLIKLLQTFKQRYPHLHVILEPGAVFAWETGYLVSTVLDVVENDGIKTAMLDVSFSAHMPDCLEMPYKPVILGATDEEEGKPTYRMGGNSCLSGDYIGSWSFNNPLKVGDKIVFNDMIHYTMVKTTTFNGVRHPSIGIWNDKQGFRLVRRFGYEDYKNKLS